jgi:phosphoserine phosphatase SerB
MSSTPIHLEVSIDDQQLDVFSGGTHVRSFPVSTASKGVGFTPGTLRTPTGNFRIAEKHGAGLDASTVFKARVPVGIWDGEETEEDLILGRILVLDGLDADNANTRDRFIYIHGTNHEEAVGTPASHGCIRLTRRDVVELFDIVPAGATLVIHPPVRRRGKLIFVDCDSTLSTIEGIDELAASRGPEVYAQVVALTDAAMNGEIPLDEVFPRRMEIIRPDRAACERVAARYVETITPGARSFINNLKAEGWLPVILSGGFRPLIEPLARTLGIEHVEAVPLYLDESGNYAGYDRGYPTTQNLGKNAIIADWKRALLPERVAAIGDGVSDLETKPEVDVFIGFGGVVSRPLVKQAAECWLIDLADFVTVNEFLTGSLPEVKGA